MYRFAPPSNVGSCRQFQIMDSPVMNQLRAAVRRRRPATPRRMSTMFMPDVFFALVSFACIGVLSVVVAGTRLRASFSPMMLFWRLRLPQNHGDMFLRDNEVRRRVLRRRLQ
jgi:hypothetical protein